MNKKHLRAVIAVSVLVATAVAFVVYFNRNPGIIEALRAVPFDTIAVLFMLYGLFMITLIWIQRATLDFSDLRLEKKESSLLVMYSSVINFFGPLQSGPAFRAAYLKKRHNISLKKYTLATLVYYGMYAVFSGFLLLSFFIGWGAIFLSLAALLAAPLALKIKKFESLKLGPVLNLAAATLAQVWVISLIYFIELASLSQQVTYLQSLTYTGAANFALFVSLTPGAIGFREAFLLFSQQLHGIGTQTIAAASVVDRSVYIAFLLLLAALIFGLHADTYLKSNRTSKK